MEKDLILIGASGVCHEIADTIFELNKHGRIWNILGIIDDDADKWGTTVGEFPIIGGREQVAKQEFSRTEFLVAFSSTGSYLKREVYVEKLQRDFPGIRFAQIIHPKAHVSPSAKIGVGTFIGLGAVVDARTVIGNHCIILFNSIISRFVEVGDFTFISSSVNITGNKTIGRCVFLGVKSTINANIKNHVLVSAGTLVMKDIEENCIAFNHCKAKVIAFRDAEELMATVKQFS